MHQISLLGRVLERKLFGKMSTDNTLKYEKLMYWKVEKALCFETG